MVNYCSWTEGACMLDSSSTPFCCGALHSCMWRGATGKHTFSSPSPCKACMLQQHSKHVWRSSAAEWYLRACPPQAVMTARRAAHRSAETCASALSQPAAERTAQRSCSVARALVTYSTLPAAALPLSAASRFFTRKRAVCAAHRAMNGRVNQAKRPAQSHGPIVHQQRPITPPL